MKINFENALSLDWIQDETFDPVAYKIINNKLKLKFTLKSVSYKEPVKVKDGFFFTKQKSEVKFTHVLIIEKIYYGDLNTTRFLKKFEEKDIPELKDLWYKVHDKIKQESFDLQARYIDNFLFKGDD